MADDIQNPSTESKEFQDMKGDRQKIADILDGGDAVRGKRDRYLPTYPDEGNLEYEWRLKTTPWRPEFADALRNLVSRPFGRDVTLRGDNIPEAIAGPKPTKGADRRGGIVDDVDGRGNSLTIFARNTFERGIAMGMAAIFVDYPDMNTQDQQDANAPGRPLTVAEVAASGARPYWVFWDALQIIALYTSFQGGKIVIEHMRVLETVTERDGFKENTFQQIRVLEPGRWQIWRKVNVATGTPVSMTWSLFKSGVFRRGTNEAASVPVALFFTGKVEGAMKVKPPLAALADMQIELYRAGSRKEEILTYAGSPMLKAKGLDKDPNGGSVVIGPRTVLYAPPAGDTETDWDYLQPNAANIKEVRENVSEIVEDMRRLGMQPALDKSGNPTATGQSIDAAKAHSTLKAWSLGMNDTIEQAFVFTTEYLGLPDLIQTSISTDFAVMPYNKDALTALQAARTGKEISSGTYLDGLKRFEVLRADLDIDQEVEKVATEMEGLEAEPVSPIPVNPITGEPKDPAI